jgi:hypothetical protein
MKKTQRNKKSGKKLTLTRETLRSISDAALGETQVAGGTDTNNRTCLPETTYCSLVRCLTDVCR